MLRDIDPEGKYNEGRKELIIYDDKKYNRR